MKRCTRCGTEKDLATGFYRNKRSRDGYLTVCRACVGDRQREYVAKNKDRVSSRMKEYHAANRDRLLQQQREYKAKHKARLRGLRRQMETGFSPELFDVTVAFQDGKCGICAQDLGGLPPHHVHADHCHDTGEPRGVLCQNCNTSIGRLGDNIAGIKRVLAYLENPPAEQMKLIA